MKLIKNSIDIEQLQTSISHGDLVGSMASCEVAKVNGQHSKGEVNSDINKISKGTKLTNGIHSKAKTGAKCNGKVNDYYDEVSDDDFQLVLESSSEDGSPRKKIDDNEISAPQIVEEIENLLGIKSNNVEEFEKDLINLDSVDSIDMSEKDEGSVVNSETETNIPQEIEDIFDGDREANKVDDSLKNEERELPNHISETECDSASSNMHFVFDEVEIGADNEEEQNVESSNEKLKVCVKDVHESSKQDLNTTMNLEKNDTDENVSSKTVVEGEKELDSNKKSVVDQTPEVLKNSDNHDEDVEDIVTLSQTTSKSDSSAEWLVLDSIESSEGEFSVEERPKITIVNNGDKEQKVVAVNQTELSKPTSDLKINSLNDTLTSTSGEVQKRRACSIDEDKTEIKKPKLENDFDNSCSQSFKRHSLGTTENEAKRLKVNETTESREVCEKKVDVKSSFEVSDKTRIDNTDISDIEMKDIKNEKDIKLEEVKRKTCLNDKEIVVAAKSLVVSVLSNTTDSSTAENNIKNNGLNASIKGNKIQSSEIDLSIHNCENEISKIEQKTNKMLNSKDVKEKEIANNSLLNNKLDTKKEEILSQSSTSSEPLVSLSPKKSKSPTCESNENKFPLECKDSEAVSISQPSDEVKEEISNRIMNTNSLDKVTKTSDEEENTENSIKVTDDESISKPTSHEGSKEKQLCTKNISEDNIQIEPNDVDNKVLKHNTGKCLTNEEKKSETFRNKAENIIDEKHIPIEKQGPSNEEQKLKKVLSKNQSGNDEKLKHVSSSNISKVTPEKESQSKAITNLDKSIESVVEKARCEKTRLRPLLKKFHKDKLKKMTRSELEEAVVLKICEAVTDRSEIGQLRLRCQTLEQNNDLWRKKAAQFEKQNRELEMVLKRFLTETAQIKRENQNKMALPIKVTRSVGLQVVLASSMHGALVASKAKLNESSQNNPSKLSSNQQLGFQRIQQQQQQQLNRPKQVEKEPVKEPVKATTYMPPAVPRSRGRPRSSNYHSTLPSSSTNSVPRHSPAPAKATPPSTPVKSAVPTKTITAPGKDLEVIDLTDREEKSKSVIPPTPVGGSIRVAPSTQLCFVQSSTPVTSTTPMAYIVQKAGQRQQYIVATSSSQSPTRPVTTNQRPTLAVPVFHSNQIIPVQATSQVAVKAAMNTRQVPQGIKLQQAQITIKHPAPLPAAPPQPVKPASYKMPPPRPQLKIAKTNSGIMLSWSMSVTKELADMASYQLYAYQEGNQPPSTNLWKKVGDVKALPLPMACTLTQFIEGHKYHFAVRAVDIHGRIGPFSQPSSILLNK